MNEQQKNTYLKCDGMKCPYCGDQNINPKMPFETSDTDVSEINQRVVCKECGQEWVDVFKLSDVRVNFHGNIIVVDWGDHEEKYPNLDDVTNGILAGFAECNSTPESVIEYDKDGNFVTEYGCEWNVKLGSLGSVK